MFRNRSPHCDELRYLSLSNLSQRIATGSLDYLQGKFSGDVVVKCASLDEAVPQSQFALSGRPIIAQRFIAGTRGIRDEVRETDDCNSRYRATASAVRFTD